MINFLPNHDNHLIKDTENYLNEETQEEYEERLEQQSQSYDEWLDEMAERQAEMDEAILWDI